MLENEIINPIPYSREAEEALLGAVIINPDAFHLLDIEANDFYILRHQWIWQAFGALIKRGIAPDFVTLSDELQTRGQLAEIGGPAYLAVLINSVPTSMNADHYAGVLKDKSRRRAMWRASQDLGKAVFTDGGNLDDTAMQVIQLLTGAIKPRGAARPLAEYISALYDDVEERSHDPKDIFGYETGLHDFDKITGGLQPGEVLYIGGEPGIGKSIMSVQMGIGMAQHTYPGAIYSLEMTGRQLTRRMVSYLGKMETAKLKTGRFVDNDWTTFSQACTVASALPIWLSDDSYWTTAGMRADLARLKAQHNIQWFVLDYLYLMSDGMGQLNPIERTEVLSSRIKMMCKEFDLAGITVNSVTKDGEDIRGSGQIKHDADIIVMLKEHQPDVATDFIKHDNMRTLVFKKGRELASPRTYMHFIKHDHYPAFADFTPEANAQRITNKNGRVK